ncbi:hypothetical protein E4U33_007217 [Claviceps sp. LM78 group G4]|nr:hypothetical protein E4U33_007217 [Claviceps sp. LM78 group G4]
MAFLGVDSMTIQVANNLTIQRQDHEAFRSLVHANAYDKHISKHTQRYPTRTCTVEPQLLTTMVCRLEEKQRRATLGMVDGWLVISLAELSARSCIITLGRRSGVGFRRQASMLVGGSSQTTGRGGFRA